MCFGAWADTGFVMLVSYDLVGFRRRSAGSSLAAKRDPRRCAGQELRRRCVGQKLLVKVIRTGVFFFAGGGLFMAVVPPFLLRCRSVVRVVDEKASWDDREPVAEHSALSKQSKTASLRTKNARSQRDRATFAIKFLL